MNWQALTTTIVSGVIAVACIVGVVVTLVATSSPVPSELTSVLLFSSGAAVGSAKLTS